MAKAKSTKDKLAKLRKEDSAQAATEPVTPKAPSIAEIKSTIPADKSVVETEYFCRDMEYTFSVPVIDKDGKPVNKINFQGQLVYKDGLPVSEEKVFNFQTLSSKPGKQLSVFRINANTPENVVKKLQELCDDRSTSIMTSAQYDRSRNEAAYDAKQEVKALKSDNVSKDAEIEALKEKLENLKG